MSPLIFLDWRLWAAVIVAAALAASHWKVFNLGKAEINAAWSAERADRSRQALRIVEKTIEDTADLQTKAEQTNGVKNETIATISTRAADIRRRVRDSPARSNSSDVVPTLTANGASAAGCSGERLPEPDGDFLIEDAADAAVLQAGLKACYAQHEDARNKINALKSGEP